VPSLRPLVWTAKQIATLRHLAGDRLRLGVASGGGGAEEYQLAGFDPAGRVRRTEDFLRLLPSLLAGQPTPLPDSSGGPGRSSGPDSSGAPVARLRPVVPVPPIWVGGASAGALRRAVRYGDGWLSGLQAPEEFAASRRRLFELADEAGLPRPRTGVGLHVALGSRPGPGLKRATMTALRTAYGLPTELAEQVAVAGTPAQVAEQLDRYVTEGADLIVAVCDPEPTPQSWELLAEAANAVRRPA
jgi:alkanesulfonate monooxygenase SsuD/methylene tetrahydromethanopterin reductase-like flavin-dependent oxidoreductase (luciferase family)